MAARSRRRFAAMASGLAAAACLAAVAASGPVAGALRDRAVDAALLRYALDHDGPVLVVDIDQTSLDTLGPWPWPRDRIATLLEAIAVANPAAVGLDILLEGPDRSSPEALARALAGRLDPTAAAQLAALPDPDARLARAIGAAPTVLATLIGGGADEDGKVPPAPFAIAGGEPRLDPWAGPAALPHAPFIAAARETAVASLAADPDGRVRAVPLLAIARATPLAGFATAAIRAREKAALYVLDGSREQIEIGAHAVPLVLDAAMRFRPSTIERQAARTVPAGEILSGGVPSVRIAGKIVLVGGSAPALGSLRQTASGPLTPSVQIHADAVETIAAGLAPVRRDWAWGIDLAAAILLAIAGAAAGAWLAPGIAALAAGAAAVMWAGGALATLAVTGSLFDPIGPALAGFVAAGVAGLVAAIEARRNAAALRRRFESRLAPEVVRRIADDPDRVKLTGERREVTAVFTDVEGFTEIVERLAPDVLMGLLDRYFEGVVAIVTGHGGMVDKIVGDAVHALFNAPLDLDRHPERAVRAALEIATFGEAFRTAQDVAPLGFGRTRVGVETGPAVLGDVGSGAGRLDYTAHGGAVNTAARLEALNKELSSAICVGPVCRAQVDGIAFRDLGEVEVRGRGRLALFEPLSVEK